MAKGENEGDGIVTRALLNSRGGKTKTKTTTRRVKEKKNVEHKKKTSASFSHQRRHFSIAEMWKD